MGTAEVSAAPEPASGFLANLSDIYFAPADAFARLLRKPNFLVPMALHVALSVGFTAIWLQKIDAKAFVKARIEESGRADRIPPDRMHDVVDRQAQAVPTFSWVFGAIAPPLVVLVVSGVMLFVFRFFYSSEIDFKRSLTVVASTFAAVALLTTPLILGVLYLKDDWTIAPQEALQANVTLLLDKQAVAKPLYSLASSLDLFSFWIMFVLASGFAAFSRKPWSWALPGIAVPWALFVAVKAGLASFF